MSVVSKSYTANGSTKIFASDYNVISESHIAVYLGSSDNQDNLVSKSDYDLIYNAAVFKEAPANGTTVIVKVGTTPDDLLTSTNSIEQIYNIKDDISDVVDNLEDIQNAEENAAIATSKAAEAASSATAAAASAAAALVSENAAQSSENDAEIAQVAAEAAQTAAETAETNAELAETNAETAQAAAQSAQTSAETAQTASETAQSAAESAQASAESSAASAVGAAQAAASSATDAQSSEDDAETSAIAAANSATASASSATSASTSATTATTQAGIATTQATNSANSATASATSATNAATSESNASTSESNAATSATQAANSATAASNSADTAASYDTTYQGYLSDTEDVRDAAQLAQTGAETAETNAGTYASNASTSASNASTSETNASNSATAAATSATNASTSETNAANSATSASGSATTATTQAGIATTKASEASTSAANALTSENNASDSEDAASVSATAAASSASSASTSASNASTSETNASNSATSAASYASSASSSASTATTQASNAASSANAAGTAQLAAEAARDSALAAYDSFDDRYLGAKASEPTTDNDGNPLVAGTLYFDTTTEFMKLYTGSEWVSAYVSAEGALFAANNLSDLADASTARTNLGLGSAATTDSSAYEPADSTILKDADIGSTVQGYDANIVSDASYNHITVTSSSVSDGTNTFNKYTLPSDVVQDASYVHTDNNYTTTEKSKLAGIEAGAEVNPTNVSELTNDSGYISANQTITLSGDVSGSGTTSINVTIADDSHNHTIANVDGLQTALDAKTYIGGTDFSGTYPAMFQISGTNLYSQANMTYTGSTETLNVVNVNPSGTVDGRDIASDGSKLDGIEAGATADQTASEILTAIKTVDGSGSGLDADTLDGVQASGFATASHSHSNYVLNNGNANEIASTDSRNTVTTPETTKRGVTFDFKQNSTEGLYDGGVYFGEMTYRQYGSGSDWSGGKSHQLGFTDNSNVWHRAGTGTSWGSWHKLWSSANDGSGSGLDADTLDGVQGSSFLRSDASDTMSGTLTITGSDAHIVLADQTGNPANQNIRLRHEPININNPNSEDNALWIEDNSGNGLPCALVVEDDIYAQGNQKVWHSGNDGSGSGLDADLLDGQQGSYYATASSVSALETTVAGIETLLAAI